MQNSLCQSFHSNNASVSREVTLPKKSLFCLNMLLRETLVMSQRAPVHLLPVGPKNLSFVKKKVYIYIYLLKICLFDHPKIFNIGKKANANVKLVN